MKGFGKVTRQFVRTLYSSVCFNKPPPELHSRAEKGRSHGSEVPFASASHHYHIAETEYVSLNMLWRLPFWGSGLRIINTLWIVVVCFSFSLLYHLTSIVLNPHPSSILLHSRLLTYGRGPGRLLGWKNAQVPWIQLCLAQPSPQSFSWPGLYPLNPSPISSVFFQFLKNLSSQSLMKS